MVRLYCWLLYVPWARDGVLRNIAFDISYDVLRWMVFAFAGIGVLHGYAMLHNLYASFHHAELSFASEDWRLWSATDSKNQAKLGRVVSNLRKRIIQRWVTYVRPVFYIDGKYFDHYFLLREYLEVVAQVYQAYQVSKLVARPWINNVYVTMILLNCISTPLIHKFVPSSKTPLRRVIAVACTAFLNFVNSDVIPLVVFMPYIHAFDLNLHYFPLTYTLNEVWFANALRENQQLFVTSYWDFWSTWTIQWDLFSCMNICESLVHRTAAPRVGDLAMVVPL